MLVIPVRPFEIVHVAAAPALHRLTATDAGRDEDAAGQADGGDSLERGHDDEQGVRDDAVRAVGDSDEPPFAATDGTDRSQRRHPARFGPDRHLAL